MPFPFLGLAICAVCGWGCKKAHDIYKQNQKTKRDKYSLKAKSIDAAQEDNKRLAEEKKQKEQELEEWKRRNEETKKELEHAKNKANDSSLSEEERAQWRRKVVTLEENLSNGHWEEKNLADALKKLDKRMENNNKIISGIGLNTDDRHWIKEFLTLENLLIAVGCYVVYQLLKDDRR